MRCIALIIVVLLGCAPISFAYDNNVYIWQRNWDSHIEDAIAAIQNTTGDFTVLCGDLKFTADNPTVTSVRINWGYLSRPENRVTVAFRVNTRASKYFSTDKIYSLVDSVSGAISKTINSVPQDKIAGIQIDYDCPTSKLADYAKFMTLLKKEFKGLEISFTALPAWLDSRDFPALAKTADYYVLQVHSFKVPDSLEEALRPFSGDMVSSWVRKASDIGHPFYVSLPTYGYEVSFDETGKFIGLRAETTPVNYKPGTKRAIVMTDPQKILAFVKEIDEEKPGYLKGFFWFRLPLETDEFNWSIKELDLVMKRQAPQGKVSNEIVSTSPGLYEIYVTNTGQTNLFKEIDFTVTWNQDEQIVHDVISGYKGESLKDGHGVKIVGMPPKAGDRKLVAWFRAGRADINPLSVSEVRGYAK